MEDGESQEPTPENNNPTVSVSQTANGGITEKEKPDDEQMKRLSDLFRKTQKESERGGAYLPNQGKRLPRPPGLQLSPINLEGVPGGKIDENVTCKWCGRRYHKKDLLHHQANVH